MSTPSNSGRRSIIAEQMERRRTNSSHKPKSASLLNPHRGRRVRAPPPLEPPPPNARRAVSSTTPHSRSTPSRTTAQGPAAAPRTPPPQPRRVESTNNLDNGTPRSVDSTGRRFFESAPASPAASVASSATMNEAEVQARLDAVRQASMRQFQSMRDVHGRDLGRLRKELENRYTAQMQAKDLEVAQYKRHYDKKLRDEVEKVESMWRSKLEKITAGNNSRLAELEEKLEGERKQNAERRERWAAEKRKLVEEAESGLVSLYSDISGNAEALVAQMRQQMKEVVTKASQDTRAAHERSLREVKAATTARIEFETKLSKECEVLVKEYQTLADRAMKKAAEAREAAQVEMLEKMRSQQEDRRRWEASVLRRSKELVDAANAKADDARSALEAERHRFALLEVEVRRQFETHCRAFERRIRSKASSALTAFKEHLHSDPPPTPSATMPGTSPPPGQPRVRTPDPSPPSTSRSVRTDSTGSAATPHLSSAIKAFRAAQMAVRLAADAHSPLLSSVHSPQASSPDPHESSGLTEPAGGREEVGVPIVSSQEQGVPPKEQPATEFVPSPREPSPSPSPSPLQKASPRRSAESAKPSLAPQSSDIDQYIARLRQRAGMSPSAKGNIAVAAPAKAPHAADFLQQYQKIYAQVKQRQGISPSAHPHSLSATHTLGVGSPEPSSGLSKTAPVTRSSPPQLGNSRAAAAAPAPALPPAPSPTASKEEDALDAVVAMMSESDRAAWEKLSKMY